MSLPKNVQYQAYSAATRTVAKTRQIVMLYDGAIRFMKQAQLAIAEKRIEDRFRLLVRSSEIITGLQSSIDFDNGGDVAEILNKFYTSLSVRILSINFNPKNGEEICEEILGELKQMRDVWHTIDASVEKVNPAATSAAAPVTKPAEGGITVSA